MERLLSLCWVPVLREPPNAFLPWYGAEEAREGETLQLSATAAPASCQLVSQQWLSSSTSRLIDGTAYSPEFKKVMGWDRPVPPTEIARQLKNMSRCFPAEPEAQRCQTISSEIPRLYQLLNSVEGGQEIEDIKTTLLNVDWLWMGDSFVPSDHAAFSSPINAAPYLVTVPPDLACFANLLKQVR